MPTGLQLRLPDGRIQLDMTRRLARPLGVANANRGNSGSVVVPQFSEGQAWYMIVTGSLATTVAIPNVTISGNTLSWKWPSNSNGGPIIYGVM